jgi:hypothetical protein
LLDFRKLVGIAIIIILVFLLLAILAYGLVNLPDFYTGVAVTLVGMIAAIGYWTYRPELSKLFKDGVEKTEYIDIKQEIKKPELTVEYDEKNVKQYSPFVDGHRVLRIRVRNKGDEEAKECEGRIEAFDYDGNRLLEEQYLRWTKRNVTAMKVPPHDSVFLV